MSHSTAKDLDRQDPRDGVGRRELALKLDDFVRETTEEEASRLGVSVQELVTFAVLYYLADVDSGRMARQISTSPYPSATR